MKIKKIILASMIIAILILMITPFKTNAALQSNGDSPAAATIPSWMWQVRNMQAAGGTLGKRDVINSNLTTTAETDLDIHMEKNTEYGAMILLSASQYGKPNKVNDGETTTGNSTGIVMKINNEWVAAATSDFFGGSYFASATAKYKNVYPGTNREDYCQYTAKAGDAVLNWHGASDLHWLGAGTTSYYQASQSEVGGLLRSHSGSIFSYYGRGQKELSIRNYHQFDAKHTKTWPTRAVIVNGEGI